MKDKEREFLDKEQGRVLADEQRIATLRGLGEKKDGVRRSEEIRPQRREDILRSRIARANAMYRGFDNSMLFRLQMIEKVHEM